METFASFRQAIYFKDFLIEITFTRTVLLIYTKYYSVYPLYFQKNKIFYWQYHFYTYIYIANKNKMKFNSAYFYGYYFYFTSKSRD